MIQTIQKQLNQQIKDNELISIKCICKLFETKCSFNTLKELCNKELASYTDNFLVLILRDLNEQSIIEDTLDEKIQITSNYRRTICNNNTKI